MKSAPETDASELTAANKSIPIKRPFCIKIYFNNLLIVPLVFFGFGGAGLPRPRFPGPPGPPIGPAIS